MLCHLNFDCYYIYKNVIITIMPRQRKHIQISAEAFETLASLKTNTGISVFQLLDCLTGLDDTLTERLDVLSKNDKTQNVSTKYNSIAKKMLEINTKGTSLPETNIIKNTEEKIINHGLKLSTLSHNKKAATSSKKYIYSEKPDPAILDATILSTWWNANANIPFKGFPKTRQECINSLEAKMNIGWGNLYPKWFKNYKKHLSDFERSADSRLRALVKANIIKPGPEVLGSGIYVLSPNLTSTDWEIINGINKIKPNIWFKTRSGIKNLLDIE